MAQASHENSSIPVRADLIPRALSSGMQTSKDSGAASAAVARQVTTAPAHPAHPWALPAVSAMASHATAGGGLMNIESCAQPGGHTNRELAGLHQCLIGCKLRWCLCFITTCYCCYYKLILLLQLALADRRDNTTYIATDAAYIEHTSYARLLSRAVVGCGNMYCL
jgi:hypothetical protein